MTPPLKHRGLRNAPHASSRRTAPGSTSMHGCVTTRVRTRTFSRTCTPRMRTANPFHDICSRSSTGSTTRSSVASSRTMTRSRTSTVVPLLAPLHDGARVSGVPAQCRYRRRARGSAARSERACVRPRLLRCRGVRGESGQPLARVRRRYGRPSPVHTAAQGPVDRPPRGGIGRER